MRMIVSALLCLCAGFFDVARAEALTPYLPKSGILQGQVMELVAPDDIAQIAKKLEDAARRDPVWFTEQVKKAPKGTPLVYDPRMGVTAEEYVRFGQAKHLMTMRPSGAVTIKIATDAKGKTQFAADGRAKALNGISLPPDQAYVDTPFGQLSTVSRISQEDPKSPAGRWSGVEWKKSEIGGPVVALAVGRREETGEGIIYYRVTSVAGVAELIILYKMD
jgi:hypothetical protein